jgi:16S rRNA G966 N2-methylase RsmD
MSLRSRGPFVPPSRPKRALSNLGGETRVAGDEHVSALLAHALDVEGISSDQHVHGFHSYPARMHWATAARVLDALCERGAHVLDPFVGSGTVAIEARTRGLASAGIDLNPLAFELARVKSDPLDAVRRRELIEAAQDIAELSEARVRERIPVRANLPPGEARWYQPHILKEMAGLFEELQHVEPAGLRTRLQLVFSALVVKFSRQKSDTDEREVERTLRKGLVTEFFLRKSWELCERLEAFEPLAVGPSPRIVEGDARHAHELFEESFDFVLSSPPYGGTYDYVAHHARRFAWFGIDPQAFEHSEIGARRRSHDFGYEQELLDTLQAIAQVTRKDAWVVLLMGDGRQGSELLAADRLIEQLADEADLIPVAIASQPRIDYSGGAPRFEHLMALRRS